MIEFSVTFIYVSERCFICMIVHDNVPRERASEHEGVCACVCVRARMCVFAHVHLHKCHTVQGEMLQLLCPRAHETHAMRIQLIFVEARHATSCTWAISRKCRNRCRQFLPSWSNKIFDLFV